MINIKPQDIISREEGFATWLEIVLTPNIISQFEILEALGLIRKRIFDGREYYMVGPTLEHSQRALVALDRFAKTFRFPEYLVSYD